MLLAVLLAACGSGDDGGKGKNKDGSVPGEGGSDDPNGNGGAGGKGGDGGAGGKGGHGGVGGKGGAGGKGGDDHACKMRRTLPVALEGQEAPGTNGLHFDPILGYVYDIGFDNPMVNASGNAAFLATFSGNTISEQVDLQVVPEPEGAGVFFWNKQLDELSDVGLSGDMTAAGLLPPRRRDFNGPAFNDNDQVAFSVDRHEEGRSAVFQWSPTTALTVLADETDTVPGAPAFLFYEFGDVAENNAGDVAFVATYDDGDQNGVFVVRAGTPGIEAIVNHGDELPGTRGGTLCGPEYGWLVGGPWINDDGVVLFQANCIEGGTPGLHGSLFMRRPGGELEKVVLIGEQVSDHVYGTIAKIDIGLPGAINEKVAMLLHLTNSKTKKVIATRWLRDDGKKTKKHEIDVCAKDGQPIDYGYGAKLDLGWSRPTIARDGVITFPAEAKRGGDHYPIERSAIFECHDEVLKVIVAEGDLKPIERWHYYGEVGDSSSAVGHAIWLDEGSKYAPAPPPVPAAAVEASDWWKDVTGVFIDDGFEDCVDRKANEIAVEGQVAPGTYGRRFDPFSDWPYEKGFHDPEINVAGNATFLATFGYDSGAGVFAWKKAHDYLFAVAITGQYTSVGVLPPYLENYSAPSLNEEDELAFSVRNIYYDESYLSALFVTSFWDPLTAVAVTGDPAPGGGEFVEFFDVALNDAGDLAFIATYENGTSGIGVFLLPHDGTELEAIVRTDDLLPETELGRLCDVAGPWLSEDGIVLFQATCVDGSPQYEGSIFLKRPTEPGLEALLLRGDSLPSGGWVDEIRVGRPGVVLTEIALHLDIVGGTGSEEVIASKVLGRDAEIVVCVQDELELAEDVELGIEGYPTIAADGTIAFPGELRFLDLFFEAEAVFTCRGGNVAVAASQGEKKPGFHNIFGELDQPSNATGWVVFVDEGDGKKKGPPSGVYSVRPDGKLKK